MLPLSSDAPSSAGCAAWPDGASGGVATDALPLLLAIAASGGAAMRLMCSARSSSKQSSAPLDPASAATSNIKTGLEAFGRLL